MCRTFDVLRRRFCWFVLPALFLLWTCSLVFTENAVSVSVDGQVRSVLLLDQDGCFVYSYTHSVEKTEVREFFRVEHGGLTLFRTDMQSFGAGLPSDYGDGLVFKDGWYSMKLNRKVPVLILRVSRELNQKIAVGERKIDLSALASDGIVEVAAGSGSVNRRVGEGRRRTAVSNGAEGLRWKGSSLVFCRPQRVYPAGE